MLGTLILIIALIVAYFFLRSRILGRFTDPVTRRNQSQLMKYFWILLGLLILLLVIVVTSFQH